MEDKANVYAKLQLFSNTFSPRTIAEFNGHDVMVVKLNGPFVWHKHDDTDDFFFVIQGNVSIELRDRTIELGPGDLYVVPKGVEHRPVSHGEAQLLLIEPTGTANTGDRDTAAPRQWI